MALYDQDGTPIYNDALPVAAAADPLVTVTANVYEEEPTEVISASGQTFRRLVLSEGQVLRQSEADRVAARGEPDPGP